MSQTTLVNRIRSVFEENRDRVFLIESMTGRSWTFAELHEWGLRGAALLKSHGIGKGVHDALVLTNSAEFAAMYFSCLFI
jgi:acyl-CoA synthetase (AMP-forming)/AMP-acid ligase II